ncbi:MAG: type II toxin-antitoxin system VapC family toxin [Saprospiraceae bacterium]|nr:type II toxin-antitoxin system VapC family toxin [Saprospiraceae bacterium]
MGAPAILDSNIVIYFLDGRMPDQALELLEKQLNDFGSFVSVISMIELLGWQAPGQFAMQQIEHFLAESTILPLTDAVVEKTIQIRRTYKIKLPDAIIAATAMTHGFTLISRNDNDFLKISGLQYMNPFPLA